MLGQICLSKQCRPRSDCSSWSSLIRVFSVCYSVCIFWTQYCTVKSNRSNCRTIMVIISVVPIFRIFTVVAHVLFSFPSSKLMAEKQTTRMNSLVKVYTLCLEARAPVCVVSLFLLHTLESFGTYAAVKTSSERGIWWESSLFAYRNVYAYRPSRGTFKSLYFAWNPLKP